MAGKEAEFSKPENCSRSPELGFADIKMVKRFDSILEIKLPVGARREGWAGCQQEAGEGG